MQKLLFSLILISFSNISFSQLQKRKVFFPVGSFQKENAVINGLSVGLWTEDRPPRNTISNGIRLEVPGYGFAAPMIGSSPISENDSAFKARMNDTLSEKINGINISATGTFCDCTVSGITIGSLGQILRKVNGFSCSTFINAAQEMNGIQASIFNNQCYIMSGIQLGMFNYNKKTRGIQIGIRNTSENTRGIQIGLLNKNECRTLPLINWNFKK